jgi:hypothetical protein
LLFRDAIAKKNTTFFVADLTSRRKIKWGWRWRECWAGAFFTM